MPQAMNAPIINETVMKNFTNSMHENYLDTGFEMKDTLGKGKYSHKNNNADEVSFYVRTEIMAQRRTDEPGAIVKPSKGGKIRAIKVKTVAYEVNTFLKEISKDETGLNLDADIVSMQADALGLKSDFIYLRALEDFVDGNQADGKYSATFNEIGTATTDLLDFALWDDDGATKGFAYLNARLAGIGGKKKKWLIIDSPTHSRLIRNEKFINNDYYSQAITKNGTINGMMFGGFMVKVLSDLDEDFHDFTYKLREEEVYVVYEDAMCFGYHKEGIENKITQQPLAGNDWLIQTYMDFGSKVLANRGVFRVHVVKDDFGLQHKPADLEI